MSHLLHKLVIDYRFWTEVNVDETRKQTNSNTIRQILSPPVVLFKGFVPLDLPSLKHAIIHIKLLRTLP